MIIRKKYNIPLPTKFQFEYVQVESKYRKSYEGACVVGAGVAQSSLVIAGSLPGTYNAGQIQCSQESSPFRG